MVLQQRDWSHLQDQNKATVCTKVWVNEEDGEITQTDGVINVGLEPPPISIHINQWKSCKQQLAVSNDQNDPPPTPVL